MEKESIELVYIGDSNKFFKYGNHYIFKVYNDEMECIDETEAYHIWSIKEAFQSFVSPEVYSRMIL